MKIEHLKVYSIFSISFILLLFSCDPPFRLLLDDKKEQVVCANKEFGDMVFDVYMPATAGSEYTSIRIKIEYEIYKENQEFFNPEGTKIFKNDSVIEYTENIQYEFRNYYIFSYLLQKPYFKAKDTVRIDLSNFYLIETESCKVVEFSIYSEDAKFYF